MLNNLSYLDKKKVINIVKNHNEDAEKVAEVINMVNNSGGINYAKEKMNFYRDNALAVLKQFPDCQSKDSLEKLVLFTTERNN